MSAFDKPQAALDTSALARPSDITAAAAPLAKAADAAQARTDILAAIAPLAKATDVASQAKSADLAQARTDILAAVAAAAAASAGAGAVQGEVRRFIGGSVPAGWQSISEDPVYPSKGVLLRVRAATAGLSACAYVESGTNAGYWTYSRTTMQRLDTASAALLGPAYPCGNTRVATSNPFLVAIGKYLYTGGGLDYYTSAPLTDLLRFDTETGAVLTLAALPRGINIADATVLPDGRILFWAYTATGLTQTAAATAFWIYNPVTNLTAVEVLVSLPLLNASQAGRNLVKMPSGTFMIMEGYDVSPATAIAHTTRYSCLLTVSGNSIIASGAENTTISCGSNAPVMLATPAGAHLFYSGNVQRSYVEGVGWGPAAITFAHNQVFSTNGDACASAVALPGNAGWFFISNGSGQSTVYILLASANAPGAPLLYAKKL